MDIRKEGYCILNEFSGEVIRRGRDWIRPVQDVPSWADVSPEETKPQKHTTTKEHPSILSACSRCDE